MRFRLSTLILVFALSCVILGWLITQWQCRTAHINESIIASELARFKAYNDVYQSLENATLSPPQDRLRHRLLQNTVKSTNYLLTLPLPDHHEVLPVEYKPILQQVAFEALRLLDINSPDEFQQAIIAEGEFDLLKWDAEHPDKKLTSGKSGHYQRNAR